MKKRILLLAHIFWFGVAPASLFAIDRYVSLTGTNNSPYTNWADASTNIQHAINAASAPDRILVSNGVYYLTNQIDLNKGVTLQSVNGRDTTFINGNYPAYSSRCVSLNHTSAVLDGFTIMNAYFTNVSSGINGGGMLIYAGTVRNCNITQNVGERGGGAHVQGAGAVFIYNCNITSNSCVTNGVRYGAGLYFTGASGSVISNCYFADNYTPYRGGGIFTLSAITVVNCTFRNNRADDAGGGFMLENTAAIFRNCLLVGNSCTGAAGQGGGFLMQYNGFVQNCTIVGNSATIQGGGARTYGGGIMDNCVIVSNPPGNACYQSTNRYNCGWPDTANGGSGTNIANILINPAFVNYAAGDYRLTVNSPCVNSGTNQDWMTNAVDLDGRQRINTRYGIVVDRGAYEFIPKGAIFSFR